MTHSVKHPMRTPMQVSLVVKLKRESMKKLAHLAIEREISRTDLAAEFLEKALNEEK